MDFYSAPLSHSYLKAPLHLLLHPGDKKCCWSYFGGGMDGTLCEGLGKGPGWTQGSLPPEKLTWLHLLSLWPFPVAISLQGALWEGQDRSGKHQGRDRQQRGGRDLPVAQDGSPRIMVPCVGVAPHGASSLGSSLPFLIPTPIPRHIWSRAEPLAQVGREWLQCAQARSLQL